MQDLKDKKGLSLYNISKDQVAILKGFGILCIVLHNFFHWTHSGLGENEFGFQAQRVYNYGSGVLSHPDFLINALFSFWGHFGVQVFIFASGYGLTKQFMNKKPASYKNYIIPKFLKIYALLLVSVLCYFLLLYPNLVITFDVFIDFAKSSLLLYNNLSYDTIFSYPYSGPLWYFSLVIQLYLFFPLLYYIVDKYEEKGFFVSVAISYVLIYALLPIAESHNIPLYANFLGHMPVFIFSIGLAKFKDFKLSYKIILPAALAIFILSNFFQYIHPLGYLAITILILMIIYPLSNRLPLNIKNTILFVGQISMFIFILNGPIRSYTMSGMSSSQCMILLKALIHMLFTIGASYVISVVYNEYVPVRLNKLIHFIIKK